MNSLVKNKRTLYLAKRDTTSNAETYLTPIEKKVNYKYISSELRLITSGEFNGGAIVIKAANSEVTEFSEGDRIYLSNPESTFNKLANDADYKVISVLVGLNQTEIMLEKML